MAMMTRKMRPLGCTRTTLEGSAPLTVDPPRCVAEVTGVASDYNAPPPMSCPDPRWSTRRTGGRATRRRCADSGDCLLYTSDAADDLTRVDLGGRRLIQKKK